MPEERPPIPRRPSLIISAILAVLIFGILALLAEATFPVDETQFPPAHSFSGDFS
jgi:hypothetical protein